MAKNGIVNTNLLDKAEIENTIIEMENLPYANAIEAIEYGNPLVNSNDTLLLYILSILNLRLNSYHQLLARAIIRKWK